MSGLSRVPVGSPAAVNMRAALRPFLESVPLLKKEKFELPEWDESVQPMSLELACPVCKQSRPFRAVLGPSGSGAGMGGTIPKFRDGVRGFEFRCSGCQIATTVFWVEFNTDGWGRKIGQLPPWSIAIEPNLEAQLGTSAEHYKRALICLSQSFGLAACGYLRRVLEDGIDGLLRLERAVLTAEGAAAERMEQIDKGSDR